LHGKGGIYLAKQGGGVAGEVLQTKKPQAFSRCGQPGSKIYGYEMHPAPVNGAKTTLQPP
jgi:hypothetical protein